MSTIGRSRRLFGSTIGALAAVAVGAALASTVTHAQSGPAQSQVTFAKDVAPILYKNCVSCHRPGEIAPMSLLSYAEARPWARAIRQRVTAREMPPWFLDRTIGIQRYKNDPSLTDAEIDTIARWVDGGAQPGNLADTPAQPADEGASTWKIGTPDLVVEYPAYKVPASGADMYGELTVPFGTTEDRYIKAIQTRIPDEASRKVVHHALSYAVEASDKDNMGDSDSGSGLFLVEYASGKSATFYPSDVGVLLPANHLAKVSYHLHSIGEDVNARIQLGIVFYPKGYVPKHIQWSKQLGQESAPDIDIPAGQIVRRDGYTRLNQNAKILAWQPHMHTIGKYQCMELIYPGEPVKRETITCANWNYNWHTIYNYADDVAPIVPKGTLIHVISWYDNTATNRFNPDPKNWVGAGTGRTIDEMGFSWIGWYDMSDDEYKAELAARKEARQQQLSTGQQQQQQQQQQ